MSGNGISAAIEEFFSHQLDSDQFVRYPREAPYSIVDPSPMTSRIIYTTKPNLLLALPRGLHASLGLIGRYGLPNRSDAQWIGTLIDQREMCFLGDADPCDLMVFAWLREQLHSRRVSYLGVNEALLGRLSHADPMSFSMRMTEVERDAMDFCLAVLPDLREVLGQQCVDLLQQGAKVELDAIATLMRNELAIAIDALAERVD